MIKVFNDRVEINPELRNIFQYLINIDEEIVYILESNERDHNNFEIIKFLLDKIDLDKFTLADKEKFIDISQNIKRFNDKINYSERSKTLLCLIQMEILFNVYSIYNFNLSTLKDLKLYQKDDNNYKKFINKYILTESNRFYNINKGRLSKLNSQSIIDLRNSLIHRYSLPKGGISLSSPTNDTYSRKIEKELEDKKMGNIFFISYKDIYELCKEAARMFLYELELDTKFETVFLIKKSRLDEFLSSNSAVVMYKNIKK